MPFISSVRGSYGAQGRFGKKAIGLAQNGSGEYYISGATTPIRHATDVLAYVANPPAGKWRIQPEGWGGKYMTVYARYDSSANAMSQSIFTMDGQSTVTIGSAISVANGLAHLGASAASSFDDNSTNKMGHDLRGYLHRFTTGAGTPNAISDSGQWKPKDWAYATGSIWGSVSGNSLSAGPLINPSVQGFSFGAQPNGSGYLRALFPVHFPHATESSGVTVYFDTTNQAIYFSNGTNVSFSSLGINFNTGCISSNWQPGGGSYPTSYDTYAHGNVWGSISDGVNSAIVGFSKDRTSSDPLTTSQKFYYVVFNFANYTVKSATEVSLSSLNFSTHAGAGPFHSCTRNGGPTSNSEGCYNQTEECMGGLRLYTVDGYVPYHYHKTWKYGAGTMYNPAQPGSMSSTTIDFWGTGAGDPTNATQVQGDTQSHADLMFSVDSSNNVWFGDWGHDNGGLFNIGNDSDMGTCSTNIKRLLPAGSTTP